jgi:hypothetical protein
MESRPARNWPCRRGRQTTGDGAGESRGRRGRVDPHPALLIRSAGNPTSATCTCAVTVTFGVFDDPVEVWHGVPSSLLPQFADPTGGATAQRRCARPTRNRRRRCPGFLGGRTGL